MSVQQNLIDEKEKRGFISIAKLEELVTLSSVQQFLRAHCVKSDTTVPPELHENIVPKARKLFAILVLARLEKYILHFIIVRGITDTIFPAGDSDAVPSLGNSEERRRFLKEQWTIPPILSRERHLDFPLGTILPFLEKKYVNNGSFGVIYKLRVAEGHLRHTEPRYTPTAEVALKKIDVTDDGTLDKIMQEVIALRRPFHPNIIPLLASYTEHAMESSYAVKSLNMLFPYAEMDMERWFYLNRPPTFLACQSRSEQRQYLYNAMGELVSALAALHREVDGLVTSHHDLKPKNILVIGEKLMIADLGMSELIHVGAAGGSGVNGFSGRGTMTYNPPEYYDENDVLADGRKTFGRAFDMWAMGCIMIQVAVLVVWGWESGKIESFRKDRVNFISQNASQERKNKYAEDDSFFKSIPVIEVWLTQLQNDGSAVLQGFLAVTIQMLRGNPLERVYSWEAELDLYELLHPDEPVAARFQKAELLVQGPLPGKEINGIETPIHRAARRGNITRSVNMLQAGWSAELKDGMGYTSVELAEQNQRLLLRDILLQASTIKQSGWKSVLTDGVPTPMIHARDQRGFQMRQETSRQDLHTYHNQSEPRGLHVPLSNSASGQKTKASTRDQKVGRTQFQGAISAFIFTTTPFAKGEIPLASLVPDWRYPNQDALTPYQVQDGEDFLVNIDKNFNGRIHMDSASLFKSSVTKLFSNSWQNKASDGLEVIADEGRHYMLRQPRALFTRLCARENVRKWIQQGYIDKQETYFVTGYRTLLNAKLVQQVQPGNHAATVGSSVIPAGAVIDSGIARQGRTDTEIACAEHQRPLGNERDFTTMGERIYAICYRKVRLNFWQDVESAHLESGNCWRSYSKNRGRDRLSDTAEFVRADIEDADSAGDGPCEVFITGSSKEVFSTIGDVKEENEQNKQEEEEFYN